MRGALAISAALVAATAEPASAGPKVRFRAGLDIGAVFSMSEGGRRDSAGIVTVTPGTAVSLTPHWQLSVGASIPVAPILNLQLPVALERVPSARGIILRLGVRPTLAGIGLCESGASRCPLDSAAAPGDRGGWAFGVLGEAGVGYRFTLGNPWSDEAAPFELDLRASYLGGGWLARGGKTEKPLGGYWQGFVLGADMTF
jgi:hypothetical protein